MTIDTSGRDPGRRTVWAAGLAVAAGAVIATAHGLYQVASAARVAPPIGWLYPLITDGLALVAYAATARLHDGGRRYAASIVVLAAGLSGLAQAVYLAGGLGHTGPAPVGLRFGVGAWPAIAAALTAHLLHLIGTDQRTPASAPPARNRTVPTGPSTPSSTGSYNPMPYDAPANPTVQPRTTPDRATAAVNPSSTEGVDRPAPTVDDSGGTVAAGPARDRAKAAAQRHHARHGTLPTVTELMRLSAVARGTAGKALQDLRAERPALHLVNADVNADRENRTKQ